MAVDPPTQGELVSCMRASPVPYMTVSRLVCLYRGRLTGKDIFVVQAQSDDGKQVVEGMLVIRDAMGYLHEVPNPVCHICEGIVKCECRRDTE